MSELIWALVDDMPEESRIFCERLSIDGVVKVAYMPPASARERILSGEFTPAGVLMDVDLSGQVGELGTGPGIAQDIRAKQRAGSISEFPIVRFAAKQPVEKYIGGDPSSDDLFDLKIQKEEVGDEHISRYLLGIAQVYDVLGRFFRKELLLTDVVAEPEKNIKEWGHEAFYSRIQSSTSVHACANIFLRSFVYPTGLLICETVLAYRLGVDINRSGAAWDKLIALLAFKYKGVAGDCFGRWWSRGLESWWYNRVDSKQALVNLSAHQRVELLSKSIGFDGLVSIEMPDGSPGDKPWRNCALSMERGERVPVDPENAVRITPATDLPSWIDPQMSSLKIAIQNSREDLRLNGQDLAKLQRKFSK